MVYRCWRLSLYVFIPMLIWLCYHFIIVKREIAAAQAAPATVRRVRNLETARLGIANPTGLAFSPKAHLFQVVAGHGATEPAPQKTDLFQLTSVETLAKTQRIAAQIDDPINLTFDGKANRWLFFRTAA